MKKKLAGFGWIQHFDPVGSAGKQPTQDSRQPDPARTPTRPGLFIQIWPYFAEGAPVPAGLEKSTPPAIFRRLSVAERAYARQRRRTAPLT